jgi:hypothetical protein
MNHFQPSFLFSGKVSVQAADPGRGPRLLNQLPKHLFWQQLLYLGCSTVKAEAPTSKLAKRLTDGVAYSPSIHPGRISVLTLWSRVQKLVMV